jgi:hypothetical protein
MPEFFSGQPGNSVPLQTSASTNQVKLGYQFQGYMPAEAASSAQNQILTSTQAGLIPRGAASSGSTIVLPTPELGLQFFVYFTAAATSAATVIRTNSSTVDLLAGGGNTPTTNTAVQLNSIAAEQGKGAWFIGLSATRYLFWPMGAQVSSAHATDAAATLMALWLSVDSTG